MSIAIVMPQLGLTMEEGTVSAWLKKPGDAVKKNEPLFTVSTDKVEMDVESAADGTLSEIIVPVGEAVRVGTILVYIENTAEDLTAKRIGRASRDTLEAPRAPREARVPQQSVAARDPSLESLPERRRLASPRAKRLANELGVLVAAVHGTGVDGHVSEGDVRRAAKAREPVSRVDSGRRRLIAERLTLSVRTIPAFSVTAELNADKLLGLHETLRVSLTKAAGAKLAITDLLLTAFARALKGSPDLNATWEESTAPTRNSVDIGLAVATAKGVLAPVLRNLDDIDLSSLVTRRTELVEKARSDRLSLADLEGGVATLSNLGMYRVDHFQAIISPGQSSILAVGQIRQRPWVEKVLTVKPTLILNLTVDHRVADGAAAAALLGQIVELLENPEDLSWRPAAFPDDSERRSNA